MKKKEGNYIRTFDLIAAQKFLPLEREGGSASKKLISMDPYYAETEGLTNFENYELATFDWILSR